MTDYFEMHYVDPEYRAAIAVIADIVAKNHPAYAGNFFYGDRGLDRDVRNELGERYPELFPVHEYFCEQAAKEDNTEESIAAWRAWRDAHPGVVHPSLVDDSDLAA